MTAASAEALVRARVEDLFAGFDRLTPDEMAHLGLRRGDASARHRAMAEVRAAAKRSGREALLDEAVAAARDGVLARYAAGGLHPTWLGLNWGLSGGSAADEVAIVTALEDAAAAAVVADLLNADQVGVLQIDGEHLVEMAAGEVSEGALAHAVAPPADGYRDTPWRTAGIATGAFAVMLAPVVLIEAAAAAAGASLGAEIGIGLAAGITGAAIVVSLSRRTSRPEPGA
jgi:hypothetical protein